MTERIRILAAALAAASGIASAQSPTTSTIQFAPQSVATVSPTALVTLKNSARSNIAVTSVELAPDLALTHECTAVPSGSSCHIGIAFAPADFTGALSETRAITRTVSVYAEGSTVPHVITVTGVAEKSLVSHFYRSILRREPDEGGKAYWNSEALRIAAAGGDMSEAWFTLSSQFFSSGEYLALQRTDRGFVVDLFQTFLGREPDQDGLNYWIGQLAGGVPRSAVRAGFMFSPEFSAFTRELYGAAVVRPESNMVMDFYRGLLGRLPDAAGSEAWLARFRAAQCKGAAAVQAEVEAISAAFVASPEYVGRARPNAAYVADLYDAFMRRGGDLAGVNFWIGQLATGATSRDAMRRAFMGSPEFRARIDAVVAASCIPTT